MTLRWSEVLTLYRWELRSALRDRTIVVNSIVVPLVLYPLILWAMFTGISFVRGQTDDMAARVVVVGNPDAPALLAALAKDARLELAPPAPDRAAGERRLRDDEIDALLVIEPGSGRDGLHALIVFDASRERSETARRRIEDTLGRHRQALLREEALARGVDRPRWAAFAIAERNAASRREMGAFLLGLLLPIFFIVMVALGCLNPAIDSLAGERERGTWETLMTTAAARSSIVTAKFMTITTLGGLAGLLNIVAILLTLRGVLSPLVGSGEEGLEFRIPPAAIPVLVACALLLAALLAAGMMALASFARTFREGQSLVMPLYLSAVLPAAVLGSPGTRLTTRTAAVPVVNVALAAREAIAGVFRPLEMTIAATVTLAAIALFLTVAHVVIGSEESVSGSHTGSLFSFLTSRRRANGAAARTP